MLGGRGLWMVNDEQFEACAGDILVIKAGEVHSFRNLDDAPLIQIDVHLSPRFMQEYVPGTFARRTADMR